MENSTFSKSLGNKSEQEFASSIAIIYLGKFRFLFRVA